MGIGRFGRFHLEHLLALEREGRLELVALADPSPDVVAHPTARGLPCVRGIDELPPVDAAIVAAPTRLHHTLGIALLKRGCDIFVEKPLASTPSEAAALVTAATEAARILQVGHIERFNPLLPSVASLISEPTRIVATRTSHHLNKRLHHWREWVMDLMIHDLDLVGMWGATELAAVQWLRAPDRRIAVAAMFANGIEALFHVGAVADGEASLRMMRIEDAASVVEIDWTRQRARFGLRSADGAASMQPIHASDDGDALRAQLLHFLDSIRTRTKPVTCGASGQRAVELAHRIIDEHPDLHASSVH